MKKIQFFDNVYDNDIIIWKEGFLYDITNESKGFISCKDETLNGESKVEKELEGQVFRIVGDEVE